MPRTSPANRRGHRQPADGQIYGEAGEELNAKLLETLKEAKIKDFPILDIDHVTIGAFIRNTLNVDKNSNHEEALMDVYRVMRPGEPPTLEAAQALFHGLFFEILKRYDLSAVGRVKMNMRLDLKTEDTVILLKEDILAVIKTLVDLRDGREQDLNEKLQQHAKKNGELLAHLRLDASEVSIEVAIRLLGADHLIHHPIHQGCQSRIGVGGREKTGGLNPLGRIRIAKDQHNRCGNGALKLRSKALTRPVSSSLW